MKAIDWNAIASRVGDKRYKHIMRVVETARHLAERHGVDIEKAETAAMFHDICKYRDDELLWQEAKRLNIQNLEDFKAFPQVLHAFLAAESAKIDYGIEDEEILDAIRYHTTGIDSMSPVAEVVFLADYLEPMRNFDGVDDLRQAAEESLEKGMRESIVQNITYLIRSRKAICPDSIRCYNHYIGR